MAEGARLESVFTGNRNVGSNPTPSATFLGNAFSSRPPPAQTALHWRGLAVGALYLGGRRRRPRRSLLAVFLWGSVLSQKSTEF